MTVRRWVAAIAALPLLAVGCADDPEPKFEPSPSPSPTESTSAAEPKPWEEKSEKGAVAFAKHWIDVFNEAASSGDTSRVEAASTKRCGTCSRFAQGIDGIYQAGGVIESKGWRVLQAVPTRSSLPEPWIAIRIEQTPQQITRGNGEVESFPGGQETFSARLVWSGTEWLMNDLVLLR